MDDKLTFELINQINETLNNPLPFRIIRNTADNVDYAFVHEDNVFVVNFTIKDINKIKLVILSFYLQDEQDNINYTITSKLKNALPVMATVARIVTQYISEHVYDILMFTAMEEGSRVGVYNFMIKKLATSNKHYHIMSQAHKTIYVVSKYELTDSQRGALASIAEQNWDDKK